MKNGIKLWILVFIIVAAGSITFFNGSSIQLQKTDGSFTTLEESDSGFLDTAAKDFKHFVSLVSDAILTVTSDSADPSDDTGETSEESQDDTSYSTGSAADISHSEDDTIVSANGITLEKVNLVRVVDGDTLVVSTEETSFKVRLIGIDTPESVHSDESRNTVWGTYASDYTRLLLEDTEDLYLEYDEDPADQYGRALAYVWLSDDTSDLNNMLNAILVRDGYAYDKVYEPNDKYCEQFQILREAAQNNAAGLWTESGFADLWL